MAMVYFAMLGVVGLCCRAGLRGLCRVGLCRSIKLLFVFVDNGGGVGIVSRGGLRRAGCVTCLARCLVLALLFLDALG